MRYYKNNNKPFSVLLALLCLCLTLGTGPLAHAQTVESVTPHLTVGAGAGHAVGAGHARDEDAPNDQKIAINADIDFELTDELRTVALKGVPLHFTADVEISSQRWWWFDKIEAKESQTWRVVYNALTRQWRVGSGSLLLPESTLSDALYPMRHIRNWALVYAIDLNPSQTYYGRIRLRLDTSLLTRPLQVDALKGRAWSLATPWKNFSFSVDELRP